MKSLVRKAVDVVYSCTNNRQRLVAKRWLDLASRSGNGYERRAIRMLTGELTHMAADEVINNARS